MNMHAVAVSIRDLRKDFKVYSHARQILGEFFFGRKVPVFTALDGVTFTVGKGEVVGIMGRNGAGKSTLLRIIAGTLDASAGSVEVNGRVSAILELGTGFHPEYTGRENVRAGGACLGMSRREITEKMDAVIDFSELRPFIDQPFKTYSSGMQARLTFATAIAIEPEILIVDEALAVGDAAFQAKCYARIREFREAGGSILLVTHAENVITRFCDRAVLLEQGRMLMDDRPDRVVGAYMDLVYARKKGTVVKTRQNINVVDDRLSPPALQNAEERETYKAEIMLALGLVFAEPQGLAKRIGTAEEVEILDVAILDEEGNKVTLLETGVKYKLSVIIIFYIEVHNYTLAFNICDTYGTLIFGINTFFLDHAELNFPSAYPGMVIQGLLDITMHLTNGTFFLSAAISDTHGTDAKIFDGCMYWMPFSLHQSNILLHASFVDLEAKNFSAIVI
jgi:ABC-type polysaccharide/polyol phosphate transport system ATPase subunit